VYRKLEQKRFPFLQSNTRIQGTVLCQNWLLIAGWNLPLVSHLLCSVNLWISLLHPAHCRSSQFNFSPTLVFSKKWDNSCEIEHENAQWSLLLINGWSVTFLRPLSFPVICGHCCWFLHVYEVPSSTSARYWPWPPVLPANLLLILYLTLCCCLMHLSQYQLLASFL
jgi:hypothetical protein